MISEKSQKDDFNHLKISLVDVSDEESELLELMRFAERNSGNYIFDKAWKLAQNS